MPWCVRTNINNESPGGRVLILHEDTLTGGIGGEMAAWIEENCFIF